MESETPYTPRIEQNIDLFISNPCDFLVRNMVDQLLLVPQWKELFTGGVAGYKRMDFSMRTLPALRIYIETYVKAFESWFIEGDVIMDVILPADLRRYELEDITGQIADALLQQFRRNPFFLLMKDLVPGLNELGKSFSVDKALAFNIEEELVPLVQIKCNFRIDLRMWDEYLTSTDRTKEDPFIKTLGNLEKIHSLIVGVNDSLNECPPEVCLGIDQKV